jgi:tetratricopeptide (TPR) repeat protein
LAVLLSLSRGGALATLLAVAVCLAVCYRSSVLAPRLAISLGAAAVLIAAALTIVGHEAVARRLGTLTAGSLDAVDGPGGRRTIWTTVAKAIPQYAVIGSGVGSHREVYPMYLEWADSRKYFSHAECGYLQVTLESGVAGLGLLVAGIGLCAYWCIAGLVKASSQRMRVCVGAVSAGLVASAAHSLVDFVWYIPGCVVIVAVLAACACRLWQLATDQSARRARRVRFSRNVGLVAAAVLVMVGTWMLKNRFGPVLAEPHWERFLVLARDSDAALPFGIVPLETAASDDQYRSSMAMNEKAVAELKQVVRWEPTRARAHLRLAEAYVRLFHDKQRTAANVMSVSQIRDAVIESRSEAVPPERRLDSRRKLEEWLSAAIGDHYQYLDFALRHTRQALAWCPLLGEGYLLLGELCFLEGGRTPAKSAYLAQALKVRPFDGTVLLHAGSEAILAGEADQGLTHWRDAFRRGPIYQEQIVDWLAGRVQPWDLAEEIRFFLDVFQPDLNGLRLLDRRYQQLASPEQMVPLRVAYAQAVEAEVGDLEGQRAAALWLEAMGLYRRLDMPQRRLQCGRNALRHAPNDFRARHNLALCLVDLGQFAEAKEHLEWCLKRKPDDPLLNRTMEDIARNDILRRTTAQHPTRTY